jgi:hypothetical protein
VPAAHVLDDKSAETRKNAIRRCTAIGQFHHPLKPVKCAGCNW